MNWAQFHKTASARHGLWVMPLAVLLMVVISLASCTTHDGYLHYQSLHVSGWEYRDSAAFVVDSLPTSGTRHLTIALRKSSAHVYPYTCLAIAVHQTWKLGDSTVLNRTDTLDCTFHHPDGMVRTKGVSLYPYEFPLGTVALPAHTTGRVVIRHLMSQQSLPGFDAIGLRLE